MSEGTPVFRWKNGALQVLGRTHWENIQTVIYPQESTAGLVDPPHQHEVNFAPDSVLIERLERRVQRQIETIQAAWAERDDLRRANDLLRVQRDEALGRLATVRKTLKIVEHERDDYVGRLATIRKTME